VPHKRVTSLIRGKGIKDGRTERKKENKKRKVYGEFK
jgi:hypothetical protein